MGNVKIISIAVDEWLNIASIENRFIAMDKILLERKIESTFRDKIFVDYTISNKSILFKDINGNEIAVNINNHPTIHY